MGVKPARKPRKATRRIAVMVNPNAGTLNVAHTMEDVESAIRRWLPDAEVTRTENERDAAALVRRCLSSGVDTLAAVGGDGTFDALAPMVAGKPIAVGLIPFGSANNIADCLGIPTDPDSAVRLVASGHIAPMDLGRAGREIFVESVGVGLHASILQTYSRPKRKSFVRSVYSVLRTVARAEPLPLKLRIDGRTIERSVLQATVSNLPRYGTGFRIAPLARWNDGRLDVTLISADPARLLEYILAALMGRLDEMPGVERFTGEDIRIEAESPTPIHVNAATHTAKRLRVRVLPGAVKIVAPLPTEKPIRK